MGGLQHSTIRAYCFAVDGARLVGVTLLKNAANEKKICCLFISPDYRHQGLTTRLIQVSFKLLRTNKPLMTVSNNNLGQLAHIIERFQFELTRTQAGVYRPDMIEYFYNEHFSKSK